jgi:hypothetical protein
VETNNAFAVKRTIYPDLDALLDLCFVCDNYDLRSWFFTLGHWPLQRSEQFNDKGGP